MTVALVIAQPGRLPLKIGVILEHLLRRIVVVIVAAQAFVPLAVVEVSISELARGAIPARLDKTILIAWGLLNFGNRDPGIFLSDNRSMGTAVLIIVHNGAHRAA